MGETTPTQSSSKSQDDGAPGTPTHAGKPGLRDFSWRVRAKVEEKKTTTCAEVAKELVDEHEAEAGTPKADISKNIRRRVYDALNVMVAIGLIIKQKKTIRWVGLPSAASEQASSLVQENAQLSENIALRQIQLQDLTAQKLAYAALIERNKRLNPSPPEYRRLRLPFLIISTKNASTTIQVDMVEDRSEYKFDFSQPFEVHDDSVILNKLQLCSANIITTPTSNSVRDSSNFSQS